MKIFIVLIGIGVGLSSIFLYRIYQLYDEGGLVPEVDRSEIREELRGEMDIPGQREAEVEAVEIIFAEVSGTVVEKYTEAFDRLQDVNVEVQSVPGGALIVGDPDVVERVAAMLEAEAEEVFAIDVSLVQVVSSEDYRDGVQFVVDTIEGLLGDGIEIDAQGGMIRVQGGDISNAVEMLSYQTDVNIQARPVLSIADGGTGRVHFGRSVPVVSGYDEWDGVRRKQYEYEDLGTDVELSLSAYRDMVKLEIMVKDSAIAEYVGEGDERHPVLDSRSVTTVVDVRRGDTVMLGGIERSVERENISEIPYFSRIPVLGRIGRRRESEVLNVEVVVMVTVRQ